MSQEYIDWFYFKQGSYWIYQNNYSTQFDSLVVDSDSIVKAYYPYGSGHAYPFYYDHMKIRFSPNFFNFSYDDVIAGGGVLCRNYFDRSQYPIFNAERIIIGEVIGFHDTTGQKIGTTEIINYFDKLQVGNNQFHNVLIVQVKDFIKNEIFNFYFSKGIGTVEFQTIKNNDTSTWIINKWNIMK